MRYFYKKPKYYISKFGQLYFCDHPVYNNCTLFKIGEYGLAVIQQRINHKTKNTYWGFIDPWLTDELFLHPKFKIYFDRYADISANDLYPTVTIRQIMWGLKMKPLPKEKWETVFDRCPI